MRNGVIYLMVLSLCSGCASMFSGTTQTITLRSEEADTKFYLNDQSLGSGTVTVPVSKKNLKNTVFIAKKDGCADGSTAITTKFDATSLLGILIDFGLISILVIDWGITGAVNEAERTNYVVNPSCPVKGSKKSAAANTVLRPSTI